MKTNKLYTSDEIKVMFGELFDQIKHGDREHRVWLRDKMQEYVETRLPEGFSKVRFGSVDPE